MTLSPQTIAIITGIGGLVVPPVVSLLKQSSWSAPVKQLLAGLLSVAVAAVGIALTAPSDFALPLLTLGGLVFAATQIVYGMFFSGSKVDTLLTNVGSKRPAPAHAAPPAPPTV